MWRHGDIPVVTLILTVFTMNFFALLNGLIWQNDDWDRWWDGQGLCDIQVYLSMPLQTIYAASIFCIVRQLSQQFLADRMAELTHQARKKQSWITIAIIFTCPVIQLIIAYPIMKQRYQIGTLVGCMVVADNSWPRLLFYLVVVPVYVLLCIPYGSKYRIPHTNSLKPIGYR